MKPKLYKGVIHSLLPQKGFGFITPLWGNGDNEENIFFHLSETKGGKCYIPALASPDNRTETISKKGTKTYVPKEVQTVFFEIDTQDSQDKIKLVAKKIRDVKNVSGDEIKEATANTQKPSIQELLHLTEQTIDLTVKPQNISIIEDPVEEDGCYKEEFFDDYYDDDFDEYDSDDYYIQPSKSRKDNRKPTKRRFEEE